VREKARIHREENPTAAARSFRMLERVRALDITHVVVVGLGRGVEGGWCLVDGPLFIIWDVWVRLKGGGSRVSASLFIVWDARVGEGA